MTKNTNITDNEFELLYPEISRDELLSDEDFNAFAEGKLDKEALSAVYKKYLDFTARIRAREMEKAASILASRLSAVGALNNAVPPEEAYFTREQVRAMSRAQIKQNYEKIRKSQEKWQ